MDWQKTLNIAAIFLVGWLLLIEWDRFGDVNGDSEPGIDGAVEFSAPTNLVTPQMQNDGEELPTLVAEPQLQQTVPVSSSLVKVKTDVLDVTIDPQGGDIVEVR